MNKSGRLALQMTIVPLAMLLVGCNDGQVSYKSGGMNHTSQSGDARVPSDLSSLVYPGATISGAQTAQEENGGGNKELGDYAKFLQLVTSDSIEEVSQWYEERLKKESWNIEKNEQMARAVYIEGRMKEAELSVTISDDSGHTSIIVSKSASSGAIPDDEAVENYKPSKEVTPTD